MDGDQFLEPVGVTTGFDADNHFPMELMVEPLDVITLMLQLYLPGGRLSA